MDFNRGHRSVIVQITQSLIAENINFSEVIEFEALSVSSSLPKFNALDSIFTSTVVSQNQKALIKSCRKTLLQFPLNLFQTLWSMLLGHLLYCQTLSPIPFIIICSLCRHVSCFASSPFFRNAFFEAHHWNYKSKSNDLMLFVNSEPIFFFFCFEGLSKNRVKKQISFPKGIFICNHKGSRRGHQSKQKTPLFLQDLKLKSTLINCLAF